jgi:hypothetical protein
MTGCLMRPIARLLTALALAGMLSSPAPAADPSIQEDTDRPSGDFKWFDLPRPWLELCKEACINDHNCRAGTYMKPNVRGPLASCWLKNVVGPTVPNKCCTSGIR